MLCMVVVKKVSCSDVQGVQLLPGSDSLHWVPVEFERGVSSASHPDRPFPGCL